MKWNEEQTVKFVKEYIKYECLYNSNSKKYRHKHYRDVALKKLSASMDIPNFGPRDAYNKIRSLKSTYGQEMKRIKNSENNISSDGTPNVYAPRVKWFYILYEALMAVNDTEDFGDVTNNVFQDPNNSKSEQESNNENPGTESNIKNEDTTKLDQKNFNSLVLENKPQKMLIKRDQRSLQDYHNLLSKVQSVANSISKQSEYEHEFDIFGKSIAAQLRSMPLDVAIEAQMFMQNYISELRLKNIQSNISS